MLERVRSNWPKLKRGEKVALLVSSPLILLLSPIIGAAMMFVYVIDALGALFEGDKR